ncbi:MAG TPA: hypothetical protein HA252_04400 [Candidatus Diapherotrites archaeon]|uniref:Uncharacterized protein n=1 Tax=Candidatus Iainarchaeum sp. TaxID=3101447 RepID=A0A7J4JL27_9ARCH|nr:hypothetical protein [Candidatus Diapherotrites archaeon]HIH16617.1 hypothetical protein [Candidatus Diapherotrites archaeon]
MAKPIRATPCLRGEDARRFLREMVAFDKKPISKVDKAIVARIKANEALFRSALGL